MLAVARVISPFDYQRKGKVHHMLVLTRKSEQSIMIGDDIKVSVLSVMGEKVRIGIQAPAEVPVFRTEVYLEIKRQDPQKQIDAGSQDGDRHKIENALGELGGSSEA
jgi:carbon storage regulator